MLPIAETRFKHKHRIQLHDSKILSRRSHYKEDGLTLSMTCKPISHSLRQHMMPLMVINHVSFRGRLTVSLLLSHLLCSLMVQRCSCHTKTPPSVYHYHRQWLSNHCLFTIHSYIIGHNFMHSCFWWRLYWRNVGYMVILRADWSVISVCYHSSSSYLSIRTAVNLMCGWMCIVIQCG